MPRKRTLTMHPGPDLPATALFAALLLASCGGESVLGKGLGEAGAGGSGGNGGTASSGVGGVGAIAGTGGTGAASGTGGMYGVFPWDCDINEALLKSCGRTGCHSAAAHFADLQLTDSTVGPSLVNRPATHGDIDCSVPPEPFRGCQPSELPSTCPPGVLLIDSANVEASWMLRKLDPLFVPDSCGAPMPAPPGNSAAQGWGEERRACIEAWILSLAAAP